MASELDGYTILGDVQRPHGVNGTLKIKPATFDLKRHESLDRVFFYCPDTKKFTKVHLKSGQTRQNIWFLNFNEISDLIAAEKFRQNLLVIPESERPKLEVGEYYFTDFVGVATRNSQGDAIGTIEKVMDYPSTDVFHLKIRGKEILVPWIEDCVLEINLAQGYVQFDFDFLGNTYPDFNFGL
jgi:16S rRNA processing protein RimM